jgi:hypothetical protein
MDATNATHATARDAHSRWQRQQHLELQQQHTHHNDHSHARKGPTLVRAHLDCAQLPLTNATNASTTSSSAHLTVVTTVVTTSNETTYLTLLSAQLASALSVTVVVNTANQSLYACEDVSVTSGRAVLLAPSPPPPRAPPPPNSPDPPSLLGFSLLSPNKSERSAHVELVADVVRDAVTMSVIASLGGAIVAAVGGAVSSAIGGVAGASGAAGGGGAGIIIDTGGLVVPMILCAQRFTTSDGMACEQGEMLTAVDVGSMAWMTGELGLVSGGDDASDDGEARRLQWLTRRLDDGGKKELAPPRPAELLRLLDVLASFGMGFGVCFVTQLVVIALWRYTCNRRYYAAVATHTRARTNDASEDRAPSLVSVATRRLLRRCVPYRREPSRIAPHRISMSPPPSPPLSPPPGSMPSTVRHETDDSNNGEATVAGDAPLGTPLVSETLPAEKKSAVMLQASWRKKRGLRELVMKRNQRDAASVEAAAAAAVQAAVRRRMSHREVAERQVQHGKQDVAKRIQRT